MILVQILLPEYDNAGQPFAAEDFARVRGELTARFGGLTAFVQSPALGLWRDAESGETARDRMFLFEVMADTLDRAWWADYRRTLEARFRQDEIMIRALGCERL